MRIIICILLVITFSLGSVSESILQVYCHINTGTQVMTKLLSQSDLGTAQLIGGAVGIVNAGEKLLCSMRVHLRMFS